MKPKTVLLVEFPAAVGEFFPFSSLHCLWELRWGPWRLVEWWQRLFPEAQLAVAVGSEREAWRRSFLARFPEHDVREPRFPVLLLNAQLLPRRENLTWMEEQTRSMAGASWVAFAGEVLAAAWIAEGAPVQVSIRTGIWDAELTAFCRTLPSRDYGFPLICSLWELVARLPDAFLQAEQLLPLGTDAEEWRRHGIWIQAPERVWIAPTAELAPGVVLDAREGPIIIEEGAIVQPQVVLFGPCSVGKHSLLRAHATIGRFTAIGEHCRIGGEIAHSVVHAYANKQHEGFVGHSYLGEWVNLGAGTTTSNLKNTYGSVRLRLPSGERETGLQFLGTLCGDHTKTAIGTRLRTGAVLGVSANILTGGMDARLVPSFSWGDAAHPQPYQLDKALEVARRVMARRNRCLLPEEEALFRIEYERTWGITA
ncbi:Bifunctional protein GlmU [bacterium HR21]|nr:Bifunctional protein GlmU [bacterium HR21]